MDEIFCILYFFHNGRYNIRVSFESLYSSNFFISSKCSPVSNVDECKLGRQENSRSTDKVWPERFGLKTKVAAANAAAVFRPPIVHGESSVNANHGRAVRFPIICSFKYLNHSQLLSQFS